MLYKFVLLLTVVSLPAFSSSQTDPITLAATHYPPYTIIQQFGAVGGVDAEIVKAAFSQQNIKISVSTPPWVRALKSVEHGQINGLLSCTKNQQRSQYLYFSAPINAINRGLILKANHPQENIRTLQQASHLKIIAIRKWSTQTELESNGIKHTRVDTIPQALDMLLMRDFDAIYSGIESIEYYAKQADIGNKIRTHKLASKPPQNLYLCLGKKTPNALAILNKFNEGLATLKKTGQLDSILNQYNL